MTVLLVFLGGAVGGPSRYLLDSFVQARTGGRFPYGILLVNIIGCFILGLIAGAAFDGDASKSLQSLAGTGFCGGLTTFSTFSVGAVELVENDRSIAAASYVLLSLILGIGAAAAGYALV
ncbi:fluoride efflux transporter CrcB [Jatrophihabitans sp. DSM 45814]